MENNKIISILGIFALVILALGFASASVLEISNIVVPSSVIETAGSFAASFNLSYTGASENKTVSFADSTTNFGLISIPTVTVDKDSYVIVTGVISNFTNRGGETFSANIDGSASETLVHSSFNVIITDDLSFEFCEYGQVSTDLIEIQYIKDKKADNEEEWEWKPLDNIRIDVKLKNTGDDDEDYTVELIFIDSNGDEVEVASDEDDLEQDMDIDEGKRKIATFEFQVEGDIEEGDYKLYAKAYKEGEEDEQCASLQAEEEGSEETIKIEKDKHDVVVKEVETQLSAECGDFINFEAKIANIGEEDQDKVKVILYNEEMGININRIIDDLEGGEQKTVTFNFEIPSGIEEKLYKFDVSTEFDYDDDDENYDKASDAEDDLKISLNVLGGCSIQEALIDAELDISSSAEVGENLVINIKLSNPGKAATYILTASEYKEWADVVSIEPMSIISIEEDGIATAVITLKPTEAGEHSFVVKATSGGHSAESNLEITIAKQKGLFSGIIGEVGEVGAWLIGGIIFLILIIIIVIIVKSSSGRARTEEENF